MARSGSTPRSASTAPTSASPGMCWAWSRNSAPSPSTPSSPGGDRMSGDFQAIADRVEIEALRGEFTDAAMMGDYDRAASLFTPDGALRMPNIPAELVGQDQLRAWGERVPNFVEF